MALPVLIQHLVQSKLGAYCQRRIPAEMHDRVRLELAYEGDQVIVVESRPSKVNGEEWAHLNVARFRFNKASGTWLLDAPSLSELHAWRPYVTQPSRDLDRLIAKLDEDASGVFWS
jgi:hypothetical protein